MMVNATLLFSFVMIALYAYLRHVRNRLVSRYTQAKNLPHSRSEPLFWMKVLSLSLAWAFAVIGLMQNEAIKQPALESSFFAERAARTIDEVAFIFDVSASMGAQDLKDNAQNPSRLDSAKEIALALMNSFGGTSVSVTAFTEKLLDLVPPTLDYLYVQECIRKLSINQTGVTGTSFSTLVRAMKERYLALPSGKRVLFVLFSDGEDPACIDKSAQEKEQIYTKLAKQFVPFGEKNMKWLTIVVGSPAGAPLDIQFQGKAVVSQAQPQFMQQIAEHTNGQCIQAASNLLQIIEDFQSEIASHPAQQLSHAEAPLVPYFILAACLFLAVALMLPEVRFHA